MSLIDTFITLGFSAYLILFLTIIIILSTPVTSVKFRRARSCCEIPVGVVWDGNVDAGDADDGEEEEEEEEDSQTKPYRTYHHKHRHTARIVGTAKHKLLYQQTQDSANPRPTQFLHIMF